MEGSRALGGAALMRERLMAGASLEVTARDTDASAQLRDHLRAGSRVHVTFLPNGGAAETIAQARALREAGFEPVPHVAARSLSDGGALDDYLARLAGEAGVSGALLVAGDLPRPRGPYASTLDMLRTGAFEARGFRRVAFAGHPEGHPVVAGPVMDAALAEKLDYAAAHGLEAEIITQFCFEAGPILDFIARLRGRGIETPVRIGAAAPTDAARLMKFAVRCGVGPSLRALSAPSRIGQLLRAIGPEALIDDLAAGLAHRDSGAIAGMHFFVFGGVARAAEWFAARR